MEKRHPWSWVPSLYFAEGLPYVVVMTLSVIMYKRMEVSNAEIALYTSWLYFPWVIKPVWSPFVDLVKTKRWWVVTMQLLIGAGMAGVAFTLPGDFFLRFTLAFFWLMAFSSATHDIAADGFYMLGLSEDQQAFFIGIRNTFYRIAMLTGQGLLVMLAGYLEESTGRIPFAWSLVFFVLAGLFIGLALWHRYAMPSPTADRQRESVGPAAVLRGFGDTFVSFFRKPGIGIALVGIGLIVALLAVVALVSSPIMRLLGFRYESLGGFILYFILSAAVSYPVEQVADALPKALFDLGRIPKGVAVCGYLFLDSIVTFCSFRLVDHLMPSVSSNTLSLAVLSVLAALPGAREIEKKEP